jgi:prevent-host-death family protein
MDDYSHAEWIDVADADGHLDTLVDRVTHGARVCLTRDGKPVAWLTPVTDELGARRPISRAMLDAVTAQMPFQEEGAGDFIRRMRDDERY